MKNRALLAALSLAVLSAACSSRADRARADSAQARADSAQALAEQQRHLLATLSAQKDSIERIVVDASTFIGEVDHSISRVKGLPTPKRRHFESGIDEQIQARKDMLRRVDALVARAQSTAKELDQARKAQAALLAENRVLRDSLSVSALRVADLTATIQDQAKAIAALEARVDTLDMSLKSARSDNARAYYVVGTEKDLLAKGIVVKEGGANLLLARIGRTVIPARTMDPALFQPIDTREVKDIPVPDTTRHYRLVSLQNLDGATVADRKGADFRGALHIADADKFWAQSHFLILVQR